ncbi:hypothetical protein DFJ73DRAFT_829558 [Zopfochytrium polystomum]|nr:hypothetical protein DFJ73DRAFT_829558 [Zopfochytrium polystomum]
MHCPAVDKADLGPLSLCLSVCLSALRILTVQGWTQPRLSTARSAITVILHRASIQNPTSPPIAAGSVSCLMYFASRPTTTTHAHSLGVGLIATTN